MTKHNAMTKEERYAAMDRQRIVLKLDNLTERVEELEDHNLDDIEARVDDLETKVESLEEKVNEASIALA